MLKILQDRLPQYVNRELPDVQAGFRKGRGTRTSDGSLKKQGNSRKIPTASLTKAFDCVDHNKTVENSSRAGEYQITLPAS